MSENRRPAGRAGSRASRALAALLLSVGLVGLASGCGFDAQLLKPYTPSDGTNVDVGEDGVLKIRNVLVISRAKGEGILSTTIVSNQGEQLTGVTIAPQTLEGTAGAPVTATLPGPITLDPGVLKVLTNTQPLITVTSPELLAGSSATITMQFSKSGQVVLNAPVVDGTVEPYSTISPAPATASPSASPSPSATS